MENLKSDKSWKRKAIACVFILACLVTAVVFKFDNCTCNGTPGSNPVENSLDFNIQKLLSSNAATISVNEYDESADEIVVAFDKLLSDKISSFSYCHYHAVGNLRSFGSVSYIGYEQPLQLEDIPPPHFTA